MFFVHGSRWSASAMAAFSPGSFRSGSSSISKCDLAALEGPAPARSSARTAPAARCFRRPHSTALLDHQSAERVRRCLVGG